MKVALIHKKKDLYTKTIANSKSLTLSRQTILTQQNTTK